MSEDEDDYMSDKFLTGRVDVRPSLIHDRAKKRQLEVKTKQQNVIKKQKESSNSQNRNQEKLQEALSKPLESANKGFQLLAKMGYKAGQALGKSSSNNKEALIEPIGITLKMDRQGLGREAAIKELHAKRKQIREQHLRQKMGEGSSVSVEEFRKRTTQKAEERFVANSLKKCQVICENLDIKANIEAPELLWFWPMKLPEIDEDSKEDENPNEVENHDNEDAEDEYTPQEKLEMLCLYIRTSYNFCYWCGVLYTDVDDLVSNCPGLSKDDH